jgi:hypothetical protein
MRPNPSISHEAAVVAAEWHRDRILTVGRPVNPTSAYYQLLIFDFLCDYIANNSTNSDTNTIAYGAAEAAAQ